MVERIALKLRDNLENEAISGTTQLMNFYLFVPHIRKEF